MDPAQWLTIRQLAMQLLMHSRAGTDAAPHGLTQGLLALLSSDALLSQVLASPASASASASSDFLHQADALSRQLSQGVAHWCAASTAGSADAGMIGVERGTEVAPAVEAAHALVRACARAQLPGLALLSLRIEQALLCACHGASSDMGRAEASAALQSAADEVHALLHRYAAGFVRDPSAAVMNALAGVIAAT